LWEVATAQSTCLCSRVIGHDLSRVLIELGLVVIGLAILARIASRWGFSAIPLYLLAGLAFGNGGLAPLNLSAGFTRIGAEIGVLLLLFMLGLEYTGRELVASLRSAFSAAIADFALNLTPGLNAHPIPPDHDIWRHPWPCRRMSLAGSQATR